MDAVTRVQTATTTTASTYANQPEEESTKPQTWLDSIWGELNFFRIHLIVFTFLPLLASVIFWGANGQYKVKYIDAIYLCYSAFTSTGLQSIDLSHTTTFQQVLLWLQMFWGSTITVAWVTVLVRMNTLAKRCAHYKAENNGITEVTKAAVTAVLPRFLSKTSQRQVNNVNDTDLEGGGEEGRFGFNRRRSDTMGTLKPLRSLTIRRVDTELKKVDPSGHISREATLRAPPEIFYEPAAVDQQMVASPFSMVDSPRSTEQQLQDEQPSNQELKSDDGLPANSRGLSPPLQQVNSPGLGLNVEPTTPNGSSARSPRAIGFNVPETSTMPNMSKPPPRLNTMRHRANTGVNKPQRGYTYTEIDIRPKGQPMKRVDSYYLRPVDERLVSKHSIGLGGFPGPVAILKWLYHWILSKIPEGKRGKLFRPYPSRLLPVGTGTPGQLARYDTKQIPYFSFSAIVGKNSTFHGLTEAELDELGGVEYRGLRLLTYLVPAYYVAIQAAGWLINGLLMSKQKYHGLFTGQWKFVQPAWAGTFQATSAVTNAGISLVDTGLASFQREPGVLLVTSFESLAGNTAFPIFLRLTIWIGTKLLNSKSATWATLHFLLDHPRRCFLYLFPSHQTWFLLFIIFILNMIDWMGFLLLDIGNQTLDEIPVGWRVLNGFLQATSVRCAGVISISLSILAPAAQVLFIIMMYIAPYPIAMAVRSTNVYQDRSLGIYEEEDDSDEEDKVEARYAKDKRAKPVVWGSYLAWHAKRQLAYDIWWLAGAWLLIAILERGKIWDAATREFDLFGILFELVSAYGSVGLSLGLSSANYSLSGAWTPTSKVIICIVMIRGRCRGLPVAIDRAVMLPTEFGRTNGPQNSPRPPISSNGNASAATVSDKKSPPPPPSSS